MVTKIGRSMALTKYQEGSLRELWKISFPLMLSSFSGMAMLFVDRLLLANHSTDAHNAIVNATTFGWAIVFGWMVLASITEVFVAQYNGANLPNKFGEPVWQMIWLSLGSFLFFIPMAYWGTYYLYANEGRQFEREYFELMILLGPSFPIYAAICGFFIGQGKTQLITWLALFANLLNAGLDVALIFGIDGIISPLGVKGAAIATGGCKALECLVLAAIFLNQKNRQKYGTANWNIKSSALKECLKIGLPGAIFVSVELLGFSAFYTMMTNLGPRYITIAGICQSIFLFFCFFSEGINKGASVITGNLIGSKKHWLVPNVILAGVRLNLIFFLVMFGCMMVGTDFIVLQFLPHASSEFIEDIYPSLVTCLVLIIVYMFFEGVRFLLSGVLTAAGDTIFLFVAGSLSVWVLMVLPVYFFVVRGHGQVERAIAFLVFYSVIASLIYIYRFFQGSWKDIRISEELTLDPD